MALTEAQRTEIRKLSGDLNSDDYAATDDEIEAIYEGNGSICATAYTVMRYMLAKASQTIGSSGQGGQVRNPKQDQIEAAMTRLQMDCPDALPTVTIGSMNLGIDEETSLVDIE